ncbi:Csm3 family CRISPR-associated RAMP protein [Fusobacterium necrophorum subsp. funduliforme B35]|nr:type III-A CRISPR-associated RAMP protein Csm3 [Fusobacterium necrophorum]EYD68939.1 Csm3 family CRISPR-associated RAMP protein [Fusobacterium necrophorum subsp. funduliforme B35]
MKLLEIKKIDCRIKLLTGMRVGGNNDIIEIGGNDSPVVRNPLTREVYIPGSSIKGKMRMFMEWIKNKIDDKKGNVHSCTDKDCPICRVFGRGAKDSQTAKSGPTRISVKDAYLTEDSKKKLEKLKERTGIDTEWKYENNINRLSSAATPRNSERIPAGTEFDFSISYKILDMGDGGTKDKQYFEKVVLKALKAILLEGIGGGVSRGNGQFEFVELKVNGEDYRAKLEAIKIG